MLAACQRSVFMRPWWGGLVAPPPHATRCVRLCSPASFLLIDLFGSGKRPPAPARCQSAGCNIADIPAAWSCRAGDQQQSPKKKTKKKPHVAPLLFQEARTVLLLGSGILDLARREREEGSAFCSLPKMSPCRRAVHRRTKNSRLL